VSEQKVCSTCGTEYPLSERFCPRDGTALRSSNNAGDLLGAVVADRYHVIKKLGAGGMGTVYLAEHVKMGRKSALKVMHPGMNADPDAIARFNREASNAARLSHPNICGIYDFGETADGLIYLAMEFIEGRALSDVIAADGSLPPARAARIVHQVADALQVAHDAGIVHRDLKPDNVMIATSRDGSDLVKVVDFGIAKASSSDAQKVTRTGLIVGTPEYMSPEQLAGDTLDGRSDIYALGLVAFNCLTGALPFRSESAQEAMIMRLTDRPRTLAEIRPDVAWPNALQAVLEQSLARDAEDRYQSAAQFGREFAAAATGTAPALAPPPAPARGAAGETAPMAAALPKTRVAGPHEASPAPVVAAASAPTKRSLALPMVAGIAVVAVIGYVGATQFTNGGDAPTTGAPSSGPQTVAQPTAESTSFSSSVNPGGTAARREPRASAAAPTPSPPAPGPSAATRLQGWITMLEDSTTSKAAAGRILGESEALRATLAGQELADAWFVALLANLNLEDQAGACSTAGEVKRLSRGANQLAVANRTLQFFCQ
jgi:hypothetical protein